MQKAVLLIGGTAGTGKTTLANSICSRLAIDHRLGTGFVREIIKSEVREEEEPCLYRFTFRAADPIQNLVDQSQRLYTAVKACIDRARREGTSLLIEGTHLIPRIYHNEDVDMFIMLGAPEATEHYRRITGKTHMQRSITPHDFENARQIDSFLQDESRIYGVPYLVLMNNLDDIFAIIRNHI